MKRLHIAAALAATLLFAGGDARDAHAQGITISPSVGAYIPASDIDELRDEAAELRVKREGTLALGLNVELGWLRGSLAYASGAQLSERGVEGEEEIGEGRLLVAAADVVLRPLPRIIIVQPYLLGGLGLKNTSYDFEGDDIGEAFSDDRTDTAVHLGIGADVVLGGIGVMAEISDYISQDGSGDWGAHDAFAMVGVKIRLGL